MRRLREAHRSLDGIGAIGIGVIGFEERPQAHLTLVQQLDHGRRRPLHMARDRTAASFHGFST
jgi:hypothetical protein